MKYCSRQKKLAQIEEGDFCMKVLKCLLVSSCLFIQASLCFAEDSINLSVAPDPTTGCHQFRVDIALTGSSTLGIMPAHCSDRPSRPSRFFGGDMKMNSQVTNKFNRILIPWRYSPHGVFNNGLFAEALIGVEKSELKTAAGSSADVTFIDTGVWLGYQWVWNDGLNISTAVGLAHLSRSSLDKSISPTESSNVSDFLDRQTSSNTHMAVGAFFGWAF